MAAPADKPVRFVLVNDWHAQFAPVTTAAGYPGANERAEWMLAQLAPGGALADVDFVMSAGDLINGETLPAIEGEMTALHARVGWLRMPFYPCCGNHEIREAEGDPAWEEPYRWVWGEDKFDYVIPAGAAEIIVLNNAGSFHVTAPRREARYRALQAMLEARPEVPKILVCHIPLVPVRERDVLRASFGHLTYLSWEGELLDLLDAKGAAANVKLVLSGHLHLTGAIDRRGVKHAVVAGTASLPHDYAVVTVGARSIAVEVRNLPETLHRAETNIHGRPSFPRDPVDATHPTAESYLRGNADERRFVVRW